MSLSFVSHLIRLFISREGCIRVMFTSQIEGLMWRKYWDVIAAQACVENYRSESYRRHSNLFLVIETTARNITSLSANEHVL